MRPLDNSGCVLRLAVIVIAVAPALLLAGCGMPAAPHPPSLKLPEPVTDLAAVRAGNQVTLTWTMPRRDTDKLLLKGNVAARVCRRSAGTTQCDTATTLSFAPAADASFTDTLPAALAAGAPRGLTYFVELDNAKRRSAGLSNPAIVAAGQAPGAVDGLGAELRKNGVVLHWTPGGAEAIRLNRKLVNPPANAQAGQAKASTAQNASEKGILAPPPMSEDQNLLVETGATTGRAIDRQIQFGPIYEYRAQRVTRVTVDGKTMELDGPYSSPIRVDATASFPPDAPTGLASVVVAGENGAETAIDLSWQPNTEADMAGYAVYRREPSATGSAWQRISPAQPVVGPGYHDATVQPGHTYEYAVTAIDLSANESAKSQQTEETVPGETVPGP